MEGDPEARPERTMTVHDENNDALDDAAALLQSVSLEYLRRKRSSSSSLSAALPTGGAPATGDATPSCAVDDDRVSRFSHVRL